MQLLKILLSITEIPQHRPVNNLSNPHVPYDLSTAFYGPPGQRNIFGDYSKGGLFPFKQDICVIFVIADYQSACQLGEWHLLSVINYWMSLSMIFDRTIYCTMTTTTRIHFGFALFFKSVNPAED